MLQRSSVNSVHGMVGYGSVPHSGICVYLCVRGNYMYVHVGKERKPHVLGGLEYSKAVPETVCSAAGRVEYIFCLKSQVKAPDLLFHIEFGP